MARSIPPRCKSRSPTFSALVARYAFDGTANATAGPFHGTTTGSPIYNTGKYGSAIDLDGTDDVVTLPGGVASHDALTIATWVYWDGGNSWQRIFDFGNGTDEYLMLTPRTGGGLMRFEIVHNGISQQLETTMLATGQWVHVAVTLGTGEGRLYVNGALVDTGAITIKPTDFNPASNWLGDSQFAADPPFQRSHR
jgi:hypothetical protein